jgi:hypothetical protein
MKSPRHALLRLALTGGLVAGAVTLVLPGGSSTAVDEPPLRATPQARCNDASRPETSTQGRVPAADYASGRATKGYTCNASRISHHGSAGGFKVFRYVDRAGHVCAYYDSGSIISADALTREEGNGVVVLDMADPRRPRQTANLTTPAMQTPHESLFLNQRRGLLAAVAGNLMTAPGQLDLYDVRRDCRQPRLISSLPLGGLGHESGFAPDGRTFYTSSTFGQLVTAVDVSDPTLPRPIATLAGQNFHGMRLSADGRTLYAADLGNPEGPDSTYSNGGLQVLDVSSIQERRADARFVPLSSLEWTSGSIPQSADPITIKGHRYLLEVDEFANYGARANLVTGGGYQPDAPVGAARLINVDNPRRPFVVSNLRLAVHQQKARDGAQGQDPGAASLVGGYSAHYCSAPRAVDPGIVACSMILSGLRVFDVRDPYRPREVAYFNKPVAGGAGAFSAPAWDLKRRAVWYTDNRSGFYAVRLARSVVPRHYWD